MNRGMEGQRVRETEGQKDRETGAWETGREGQRGKKKELSDKDG